MNYCYTPMDSPLLFFKEGKCGEINHDLIVEKGDLKGDEINLINQTISALLIQLHSNKVAKKDAFFEQGWWGDHFSDFKIGNSLWQLHGQIVENRNAKADEMIREALQPLIRQGLIDDFSIEITQVVGGIEATLDISKNNKSIFRTVV